MNTRETSWTEIGVLFAALLIVLGILVWPIGVLRLDWTPAKPKTNELSPHLQEMKQELEHPMAKAAFQAGYDFGMKHKRTGLTKLTEKELDEYALMLCQKVNMPEDIQGTAVSKFKSGYGWGFWNAQ